MLMIFLPWRNITLWQPIGFSLAQRIVSESIYKYTQLQEYIVKYYGSTVITFFFHCQYQSNLILCTNVTNPITSIYKRKLKMNFFLYFYNRNFKINVNDFWIINRILQKKTTNKLNVFSLFNVEWREKKTIKKLISTLHYGIIFEAWIDFSIS